MGEVDESVPTVVSYTRCPTPTALGIAARTGILAADLGRVGAVVTALAAADDPRHHQAHFDQRQAGLIRHGGNVPVLVARSRGADVRVVATSWPRFHEPILVLPTSDITSVDDLRGRRIGVPRRLHDTVDFWRPTVLHGFARALATRDLTLEDVEHVDIPVSRSFLADPTRPGASRDHLWDGLSILGQQREEAVALLTGTVDAVFSHASLAPVLRGITGARVLIDVGASDRPEDRVNNGVPQVLTVTGDLLEAHADVVVEVLAATQRAAEWSRADRERARDLIAEETGLPLSLVDLAYPGDVSEHLEIGLGPESYDALARQATWLAAHGALDGPVRIDELIDPAPLAAATRLALSSSGR